MQNPKRYYSVTGQRLERLIWFGIVCHQNVYIKLVFLAHHIMVKSFARRHFCLACVYTDFFVWKGSEKRAKMPVNCLYKRM